MSKIINKESVANCESWLPPHVVDEGPDSGTSGTSSTGYMTAAGLEDIQKQAYEEAYEKGRSEGLLAGSQELAKRITDLDSILGSFAEPFSKLDDQVVSDMVDLVISMLRQLVRREIRTDPGQIIAIVREAVTSLPTASSKVYLHLHPDDVTMVRDTLSLSDDERNWELVDDPIISMGGCLVRTEYSQVDARVETRIAKLIAQVFGEDRATENTAATEDTAAVKDTAVSSAANTGENTSHNAGDKE